VNSKSNHFQNLLRLFGFVGTVLLAACIVSPPLYWAGSWLSEAGILPIVKGFPFHRYFSRSVQVSALILLWPAFCWIGIRHLRELGIVPNARWRGDLLAGFLMALLPVVLMGMVYIDQGVWVIEGPVNPARFLSIGASAAAVSLLEEFFFRGVILGLCLMAMSRWSALFVSAVIFSVVHFVKTSKSGRGDPVTWSSGFEQIPLAFSSAPPWPLLGWGFLSLLVAGLILGVATSRTRSLFLSIGLHAGWILGQKGLELLAKFQPKPADALLPWAGPNVVSGAVPTGLVPVAVLLLTWTLVSLRLRHVEKKDHRSA
jgi:membrane protease YdiL (CAAX protease family)